MFIYFHHVSGPTTGSVFVVVVVVGERGEELRLMEYMPLPNTHRLRQAISQVCIQTEEQSWHRGWHH